MGDGSEANLDLTKGMFDAGDHVKFGFPMAFTATVLSWSILEYGNNMKLVNELENAQESLKWITDFLINAHPSDNVLYIQVNLIPFDNYELSSVIKLTEVSFCVFLQERWVTQSWITLAGKDLRL